MPQWLGQPRQRQFLTEYARTRVSIVVGNAAPTLENLAADFSALHQTDKYGWSPPQRPNLRHQFDIGAILKWRAKCCERQANHDFPNSLQREWSLYREMRQRGSSTPIHQRMIRSRWRHASSRN